MTKEVKKGHILQARAQWSGDLQNKQVSKDIFELSISGGSRIVDLLSLKDLFFYLFDPPDPCHHTSYPSLDARGPPEPRDMGNDQDCCGGQLQELRDICE